MALLPTDDQISLSNSCKLVVPLTKDSDLSLPLSPTITLVIFFLKPH